MSDAADRLREEEERWRREVRAPFADKERRDEFRASSAEIPPLSTPGTAYGPDADAARHHLEQLGFPGEPPYTRGIYPTMHRGRLWTMRQYAGFGTAEESNARYRWLIEQGTTGLSIAFDLPTQMGFDSDHPMSRGEVGKSGVAIDSLADMEVLLDGIDLGEVSTSMTINATASTLLCMYVAVAEKQGTAAADLRGTVQNDILKEYIARGTYIYPVDPSLRIITDMFSWCDEHVPQWNTISISGYHIREAGCTAAQEIAFTLADGLCYVQRAVDAGLDVNRFGRRLSFFFNGHNHFLEEVAKFRAARRLWARLLEERFGCTDPKARMLRFHCQTAGSTLTAQGVSNNAARVTVQALAAVLGGCQSLHTNAMDEALALPTEDTARLALRTQQILAHESGAGDAPDPLGGSYLVEELTDALEAEALELIEEVDALGGAPAAVESGWFRARIGDAAYETQRRIDAGEQVVVGVNRWPDPHGGEGDILRLDPALEEQQVERVRRVRDDRDGAAADRALAALADAARGTDNLMPPILDAVRAYCTVGEIADAMRGVFGEHRPQE